jgi:hypothetical protein
MEKIVSKKARQLDRVLQDIYKSVTIEDQLTLQAALQLYFVFQLNAGIISLCVKS